MRIYALVKDPKTGQLSKVPIKPSASTSKLERRMIQDTESKLWMYKHKYEYLDKNNQDKA